eukprot:CAMPEP_0115405602 /NCGR_PEP_ID=MMETSP0271-20121206/18012_1 /TAXON_ID=71861 /ORGANISM="Scrippsiella trochoidea, Strain CCMP3099" /LENGTH=486 /DNA_ID=CAMNT_0002829601 /DNA_START=21 /DNA_END=1477 /DNA_ORIENTATION=-
MEQVACREVVSMPTDACPKRRGRKLTAGKRSLTQSTACTEGDNSPMMSPMMSSTMTWSPGDYTESSCVGGFSGITEEVAQMQTPLPPGLEQFLPTEAEKGTSSAPQGAFSSAGSFLHGTGLCRPCAWLYKPNGCQNGAECNYCHVCPEGEIKARRKNKVVALRSQKSSRESTSPKEQAQAQTNPLVGVSAAPHEEQGVADLPPPPGLKVIATDKSSIDLAASTDPKLAEDGELGTGDEMQEGPWEGSTRESSGDTVPPPLLQGPTCGAYAVIDGEPSQASVGSALHGTGACKPCVWFHKPVGCANGWACRHCHSCPEGANRERRKTKFAQLKKQLSLEKALSIEQSLWAVQQHQEAMLFASMQVQAMWRAATAELQSDPKPEARSPMSVPLLATVADSPLDSPLLDSPPFDGLPLEGFSLEVPPLEGLPSKGSALHAVGKCRPCAWLWKATGCQNGQACEHCHACPPGELKERKRLKAAKREKAGA